MTLPLEFTYIYVLKYIKISLCIFIDTSSPFPPRSVGCTLVEMLTGKPPYGDYEPLAAMYQIVSNKTPKFRLPPSASPLVDAFLALTFRTTPTARPSAQDLLKTPFAAGASWWRLNTRLEGVRGWRECLTWIWGRFAADWVARNSTGVEVERNSEGEVNRRQSSEENPLHSNVSALILTL